MLEKLKLILKHEGFIKYFKNTSWLLLERVLRLGVGLFIGIWIARYLGAEQFGLFSYAQSFAIIFSAIATLGLNSIVVRELVKDDSKRDKLIGTSFLLRVLGAFITLGILYLAINFTSNDSFTNTLIFIIASSVIFQSFNVIDLYFQSKVLSKYVVFSSSFTLLISSVIKICLIVYEASLIYFAIVVLIDSFILACALLYHFLKKTDIRLKELTFDILVAKSLLKDSWPLIFSAIIVSIYMKIDQVMIKEMLGSEAVGYYSAAVRLSEAWYFIPMIIASSVFPAIVNAKKTNQELYDQRLQRLYDFMVWSAVIIAVPMTFFSHSIINLLYGNEYIYASDVLMIHIWASIFVFLGVASSKWFINENLQKLSFLRTLYGMLINVVLNLLLIPTMGIEGAAIATLISYMIAGFISDYFNTKTRNLFFIKLNTINFKRLL